MRKSDAATERVLDMAEMPTKNIDETTPAVVAAIENSTNADNKKIYPCVLCEDSFAEHNLMIEHFR